LRDFGGSFCFCEANDFIKLWERDFIAGAIIMPAVEAAVVLNKILHVALQ
jgi:hypothetical protein